MKKKQFFYPFVSAFFAASVFAGGIFSAPCSVKAEANEEVQLQQLLEKEGFYVQQGSFYELDTIKEASAGRLLSCFGNNAGSSYMVFNLPAAPEQDNAKGNPDYNWPDDPSTLYDDPDVENAPANPYFAPGGWQYKLKQDEAIVLITHLPPD